MNEKIPYRQIHLDFHTSEKITGVGEMFNAKEFAKTLKDAHVNSINIFGKCHHGMFYYPTKIGTPHPGLTCPDLLGEQVKALKDEGIRFTIYTCVGWNEEWAHNNPQWQQRDKSGVVGMRAPFERNYYSWNDLCLNKVGYKDALKAEIFEEYELFKPVGFWIDIVLQKECVCDDCIADMNRIGLNPTNEEHVKRHDRMVEIEFCKEFYEYIKGIDENLEVYFNSLPYEIDLADEFELSSYKKREYFDFIDIESLPSETWGYSHFPMAVNYLNKYEKEVTMMNGKFHMAWGDFGSMRNKDALEYECFRAIANGAKVCIGDQLHPSGKLDPIVYERIGEVFKSIEEKEPWLIGTRKIAEVGVLTTSKVLSGEAMSGNVTDEGAYRILTEGKIQYDFINLIDDISGYKLIILPDNAYLTIDMAKKLNNFTQNGGKILATGSSGLIDGEFVLDSIKASYVGLSEFDTRYIRFEDGQFNNIPQIDHVLYQKGHTVKVTEGGKILAKIVAPYFNRNYEHFCSHRQTPPIPTVSDEAAIIESDSGIYISSMLFTDYSINGYKTYKDIVLDCIKKLIDKPLCIANLPALSEVTLRKNDDGIVVHTVSYSISRKCKVIDIIEDAVEIVRKKYEIYTGFCPSKVLIVPELKQIDFTYDNGYTQYNVEYQCGYSMVFIEK